MNILTLVQTLANKANRIIGLYGSESTYQKLLAKYLEKEGFILELEYKQEVTIDGFNDLTSARFDILILGRVLNENYDGSGIVYEFPVIIECKKRATGINCTDLSQIMYYLELYKKAKYGIVVCFHSMVGYGNCPDEKLKATCRLINNIPNLE